MNKNKIVIFDWGGVIESHKEGEYNEKTAWVNIISKYSNTISEKEILDYCEKLSTHANHKKITEISNIEDVEKWFIELKNNLKLKCTFKEFCLSYKENYNKIHYYKDVVEYAHSLKTKCKIGILSNLGYLDKERIDMQLNLKKFDYVWLSFELNCRKPDEKIYEIVDTDLNIDPNSILFIDDTKENIDMAKKRGWNTCLACGYELDKIKKSVEKFLKD